MSKAARPARQQLVEAIFRVGVRRYQWQALTLQTRHRDRDGQTLRGDSPGCQIGETGIDDLAPGKAQVPEARGPEAPSDPSGNGRPSGDAGSRLAAQASRPGPAAGATVATELLTYLEWKFHGIDSILRG